MDKSNLYARLTVMRLTLDQKKSFIEDKLKKVNNKRTLNSILFDNKDATFRDYGGQYKLVC